MQPCRLLPERYGSAAAESGSDAGADAKSVFENSCNAHFGTIQGPCTGRFNHPNPLHISPAHLRIGRFADSHKYYQNALLQDLGFLAFTLPDVAILMPTKKPRGEELTREQHRANQVLHQRRRRMEHVNSRVKRCRIVKDRLRLWKQGVRDLVMDSCCALHKSRVRLTPWQPIA